VASTGRKIHSDHGSRHGMTRTTPPLSFHEVTPDRWPDLERLFSAKGGPSYCWCMPFRDDGGAAKKSAMRERVLGGTPVGLLAYRDEEPIAWCSVAPKATFERLGKDAFKDTSDLDVTWSITCFFDLTP
jgi:hypothetical protein